LCQIPGPWEEEKFFKAGDGGTIVTATNFTYAVHILEHTLKENALPTKQFLNNMLSMVLFFPTSHTRYANKLKTNSL
jgi:hypothetical protein